MRCALALLRRRSVPAATSCTGPALIELKHAARYHTPADCAARAKRPHAPTAPAGLTPGRPPDRLACAPCRAAGLLQRDRPSTYWAWDQHDATHLVTSYVGSASGGAALLLVYRVLAFVYFAAALLLIEFAGKGLDGDFLPYFTNWTHIALGVYAVLGVVLSLRHRRTERRDALGDFSVTRPYGLLEKLFVITLTLASACGAFLTLFYWGVIYTRGSSVRVDNAMRHGGNVVVFVGEYLLSRTPVVGRWFHFALIYASMYAGAPPPTPAKPACSLTVPSTPTDVRADHTAVLITRTVYAHADTQTARVPCLLSNSLLAGACGRGALRWGCVLPGTL